MKARATTTTMALLSLRTSLLFIALLCNSKILAAPNKQTYIVHMAKSHMPADFTDHHQWYESSLRSVSDTADILYRYDTVAHGFSARLTAAEARALGQRSGVLNVVPELRYELHTTRTPEFLGLDKSQGLIPESSTERDVVVGVLDTGVWPERKSYDDTGFGPVPSSWKGECEQGKDFKPAVACNRKLIGARSFSKGYEASLGPMDESRESRSPRDNDGHGTHTSSTATGSAVSDANLFGFASGTARGMATGARLAVYKVCWLGGCFSSDILAGMDKAVEDGCGILSLSLGGGMSDYSMDSVAIGAFSAMEKGVLVSCSAGNAGPEPSSLSNVAPWITTVGAGTLDRDFPASVALGNGHNFTGVSLYSGKPLSDSLVPVIYAANASSSSNGNLCMKGTLLPDKVAGKIVVCDRGINSRVQKGVVVRDAGGAGMILANTDDNGEELVADAHLIPAVAVGQKAAAAIKAYISTASSPKATVAFGGTKVGVRPSPVVAAFSSRGPNGVTPDVLKPDIIAPGVNILAAWTGAVGPTGLAGDTRRSEFNIISGTSMSCPHVSGLAALVKGAHPEWSPAAVKSALMTTAYSDYGGNGTGILDAATGDVATPFDVGAGHVDPVKALDPGLVYDLSVKDYLDFLCALNYTASQIASVAKRANYTCDAERSFSVSDLNYPSFAVPFETASGDGAGASTTVKYRRTLTNVGPAGTYRATVKVGGTVKVAIEPKELAFGAAGEKKSFTVRFTAASQPSGTSEFGRIEWTDGKRVVGSPVAFTWT